VSYRFKHWWSLLPFPVAPLSNLMQFHSDFPHLIECVGRSLICMDFLGSYRAGLSCVVL
jgi:hypothetical protein